MAADDLGEFAQDMERVHAAIPAIFRSVGVMTALRAERQAKLLATSRLSVRSGHLRRSIKGAVHEDPSTGGVTVALTAGGGSGKATIRYAGVQEHGALIRPRKSKYLAIPVGPAKTAAGVARYDSPRAQAGLSFRPRRGGKPGGVLVDKAGRVNWVLVTHVRVRGKHYLRDGLAHAALKVPEALRAAFVAEVMK